MLIIMSFIFSFFILFILNSNFKLNYSSEFYRYSELLF
ncbi:Protein of unknown function (DUF1443) [Moritella viscosa]|nr:Protein of unknown function (DUF1443) [Moritella viscosa]SGY85631.1 Protein of unknown function (DUF1443) [Moritella viscosa]